MNENRTCSVCGAPVLKEKSGNAVHNINDEGKITCEVCRRKRLAAEMEKTFDEPLHRDPKK